MSCSIPDFINDIPTIAPLPAFPIVCATSFPPALTIPDIPLPPCIDGLSFTSSGINVTVIAGSGYSNAATSSSSFNITEGNCAFNFGGTITINLPDVAASGGGSSSFTSFSSGGCATCQSDSGDISAMINAARGGAGVAGDTVTFRNGAVFKLTDASGGHAAVSLPCDRTPFTAVDVSTDSTTITLVTGGKVYAGLDAASVQTVGDQTFTGGAAGKTFILTGTVSDLVASAMVISTDISMPSSFVTTAGSPLAQTQFKLPIARMEAVGSPVLSNFIKSDLRTELRVHNGTTVIYPVKI